MKKIELGQTIAIIANVGVITGIAFLAIELRQNNEYMAANARYDLLQNQITLLDQIASSPELSEILIRAADRGELSRPEQLRLQMLTIKSLRNWEWEFGEYQSGRLELGQLPVDTWRLMYHGRPGFLLLPFDGVWNSGPYRRTNPAFARFMEENIIKE